MIYQASPDDSPEILQGNLLTAIEGRGAAVTALAAGARAVALSKPDVIAPRAELPVRDDWGRQAVEELTRRGIEYGYRRSMCFAVAELLLGGKCAVIQDGGPMEWDIAAAWLIAKEAGAQVWLGPKGTVAGCRRYATVMAWDEELFALFRDSMP